MIKKGATQLVFCHLPKSGGKTFADILSQQFDTKPVMYRPSEGGVLSKSNAQQIKDADVIWGHFCFWLVYPYLRKDRIIMTWMRDPLERNLSLYNYWTRVRGNIPIAKRIRKEHWTVQDFFELVDSEKDPFLFANLSFLGLKGGGKLSFNEMVANAKEALDLQDFIGITETYSKDLKRLKKRFGFDVKIKKKRNVTPDWAKRTTITKEERIRWKQLLGWEYDVYHHAKHLAHGYEQVG